MTNPRPLLPIVAAVLLGGAAHAGELSLGGPRMVADAATAGNVDVTVNFTDRGALRDNAEGGDSSASHDVRAMRGADGSSTTTAPARPSHAEAPSAKGTEPATATTDSPHGVSISPSTAIRRPSYRWQSLVPGTIK